MKKISELMDLSGKKALITGALGGIGQCIAEGIAELGGDLILVDMPNSDYDLITNKIKERYKVQVDVYDCDLEIQDQREKLINNITGEIGELDILINNAGFVGTSNLQGWVDSFENQTIETWRRALEVNLTAAFDLSKGFSSLLKAGDGGSIINIASIYAVVGPNYSLYEDTEMGNPAAYAASKGGLVQLTTWLATTMAPEVRVNTISPGGVFRNQQAAFVDRYENLTPLRRMANENDFNGSIVFLASDLSSYITGQNLIVDGGWTAW